jgi:hypothetical protein
MTEPVFKMASSSENMSFDATSIARIRNTICGELILFHHLIGATHAALPYLQSCAARYAKFDRIGSYVELKLRISAWLNREGI